MAEVRVQEVATVPSMAREPTREMATWTTRPSRGSTGWSLPWTTSCRRSPSTTTGTLHRTGCVGGGAGDGVGMGLWVEWEWVWEGRTLSILAYIRAACMMHYLLGLNQTDTDLCIDSKSSSMDTLYLWYKECFPKKITHCTIGLCQVFECWLFVLWCVHVTLDSSSCIMFHLPNICIIM